MQIGFIGLGVMGSPMCRNLIKKSGFEISVYDINVEAMQEARAFGAGLAKGVQQLGEECNVVFTMLPRDQHVKTVYGQLFALPSAKRIYIDMSTISPSCSREMADAADARGEYFLDAPVVKSRQAAEAGELGIYVGGNYEIFLQIKILLECMGNNILYMGNNGSGLVMKLCHNMLVGQIQNGVNEMLTLAKKAGDIDVNTFAKAIACGGGKNFYLESKAEAIDKSDYTTAFAVEYMHKDVHLAADLCRENDLLMDGVKLVTGIYDTAMESGLGKLDFSSVYKLFGDAE